MKTKQVLTLSIILLVLIVAVILKQQQKPAELATDLYAPLDLSFDKEKVARIDIAKFNKEKPGEESGFTEFLKEGAIWRGPSLWNARINPEKINELLDTIMQSKGELRGKDKNLHPDFGITNDESYRVMLQDDKGVDLLTLRIGTVKTKNGSIFLRKEGSDAVYMTDADLFGKMGIYADPKDETPNKMYWASTQMVEFDTAKVNRLETRRFNEGKEILSTHVVKTDGVWNYARPGRPFPIDGEKITQFLDSLKSWHAQAVSDPELPQHGLDKPTWKMTLGFDGGEDVTLTAGQPHEESRSFPIKPSNEPVVYPLTVYYFENMDVDDSRFFITDPYRASAENLSQLKIQADKIEQVYHPSEKTWEGLTTYLDGLKNFRVERMIYDPAEAKKVKAPEKYFIEFTYADGKPTDYLDIGDPIDETNKEYAASRRGLSDPFIITDSTFRQLFIELDKIGQPPAEAETPAETPSATESSAV